MDLNNKAIEFYGTVNLLGVNTLNKGQIGSLAYIKIMASGYTDDADLVPLYVE